jgi:signal transduction histidine kinase
MSSGRRPRVAPKIFDMRLRIWPSVGISFAVLLLLLPLFAWLVSREAAQIDQRTREVQRVYQTADDAITSIRENIYKAALVLRRVSNERDEPSANSQIQAIRSGTAHEFKILSSQLDRSQHERLTALQRALNDYWTSLSHALEMLRQPPGRQPFAADENDRTQNVLELAHKIDDLNEANLSIEEEQIQIQQRTLRRFAAGAMSLLLLLGFAIAVVSTMYLARLERVSEKEQSRAEQAEYELRRLSNQLVRVQEDERRTISRELHDEVGQILTGLRMELGSLSRGETDGTFRERLESVKRLAEDALRSVRNLALLLRPSMLDDLGLEPALRWQAKEFSRRYGIPVSVNIDGNVETLPETVRICLYRAIQEALTNCMKHAEATRVSVTVKQQEDSVSAAVQDNGQGFDPHSLETRGLGLVGMEERARALQGQLTVSSQAGKGTLVSLVVPLSPERAFS